MNRIKLKNLTYFTCITLSLLLISYSPTLYASNETTGSCEIFKSSQHKDLYWQALIHTAHNRIDQAKAITKALNENNQEAIATFKNKKKAANSIDNLFDELFILYIKKRPQYLTRIGLFESIGIRNHNKILDDLSPKGLLRRLEIDKEIVKKLNQWPTDRLTEQQKISYNVLHWNFTISAEKEKFLFHEYFINQIYCTLHLLNRTFIINHPLQISEDVDCYLTRLTCIPNQIEQITKLLEHQQNLGIKPPKFVFKKVINSIQKFLPKNVTKHTFYNRLFKNIATIDPSKQDIWLKQAQNILEQLVYPAYDNLLLHIKKMQTEALTNHGVWALPNGDEYYQHTLKEMTTTYLTADQIHDIGLKEVAHIQEQMRSLLTEENFIDSTKNVGDLFREFAKKPDHYFSETDEGRRQCLEEFRTILTRSKKELFPLFNLKPKDKVEVKRIPKHNEDGASAAWYAIASFDGSRPGIFYVNLRCMKELPRFKMETLAIHEAEPGHHFQYSIQNKLDVAILRRMCGYAACGEGWALYAERLAYEQGFYSSRASILGHLQDELLRAIRLVVDTGIHKKRWSREFAIDYMLKETTFSKEFVVTEVERYFVWPGQACGYKIGQLKILELRKKAQDKLGDKFNIVDFHDAILSVGCVPLKVLESAIDRYIQQKKTP